MSDKTSDKTSDKLLPCPLCGGEASLCDCAVMQNDKWMWSVECVKCGVIIDRENKNDVVAAWNNRKLMERIVERLEKLKEIAWYEEYEKYEAMCDALEIVKEEM